MNAMVFKSPKHAKNSSLTRRHCQTTGGWPHISYLVPNKNGPSSLPPQNNVDAGKDGSKKIGWQSSDEFRQHRFVDRDNQ